MGPEALPPVSPSMDAHHSRVALYLHCHITSISSVPALSSAILEGACIHGLWLAGGRFEPGFGVAELGAAVGEALSWAEGHPSEVREIVKRATHFATHFLNRDAVDCYFMQVLHEVAGLGRGPPQLPADVRNPHWNAYDGV